MPEFTPESVIVKTAEEKNLWRDFLDAARANVLPAIGLQSFALFLLWAYHFWPNLHDMLEQLALWKQNTGYLFSFVASTLGGALLPFVLQRFQSGSHRRMTLAVLPDLLLFWGVRGCLIDAFYRVQTLWWGDNALPQTLVIKIAVDLLLFSSIIAAPMIALMFSWVDSERNFSRMRLIFAGGFGKWYRRDVWPLLRMAWIVWLPALAVIYALPSGLQFPVMVIIQCLWALILVVLTDKNQNEKSQAVIDPA